MAYGYEITYTPSGCDIHSQQYHVFSQRSDIINIFCTCICSFFMFVYVRAREIVICPGYDAVVSFVQSDVPKLKLGRKYSKRPNVAIYIERREYLL
jgi:hypothetical protein